MRTRRYEGSGTGAPSPSLRYIQATGSCRAQHGSKPRRERRLGPRVIPSPRMQRQLLAVLIVSALAPEICHVCALPFDALW